MPGTLFVTNLVSPKDLITVDGAHIAGRTVDGYLILQKDRGTPRVVVRVAWPWYRTTGLILSTLGLLLVCSQLVGAGRFRTESR